jgi:hypothetical protein
LTGAGMALKASNYDTIPLCASHHRTGGFGVAIHAGQKTWEKKFGYQRDLLNSVLNGMRATTAGITDSGAFRGKESEEGQESQISGQEDS